LDLIAAAPALWLLAFFLVPLSFTFVVSFLRGNFGGVTWAFTFDNYTTALSGFYLSSFLRTLRFAFLGASLCILVSYPVALFISRQPLKWRVLFMVPILVPYFSSFLIRVMSWQILLARGGPVEFILNHLGLLQGPLDVLDTQTAVFIGIVYAYLPIAVVPLVLVLSRIPPEISEASSDLGASRWSTFYYITLPLSRPGIATAAILTAVPMLGELVIPMLLGGDKGVLIGMAISSQYLGTQNYPVGSAMAMLVLVAVGAIVYALTRATDSFEEVGQ
jgi:ABC-type spermidine/putrescine transport system permease subunit I